MAELNKRMNNGWVLMDCIINHKNGDMTYFLERSNKRCVVCVHANGTGEVL